MIIEDADLDFDDYLEVKLYKQFNEIEIVNCIENRESQIYLDKEGAIKLRDELTRLIKQMEDAK
jgi:hypothetical protein